jgi:hypothetical protein
MHEFQSYASKKYALDSRSATISVPSTALKLKPDDDYRIAGPDKATHLQNVKFQKSFG